VTAEPEAKALTAMVCEPSLPIFRPSSPEISSFGTPARLAVTISIVSLIAAVSFGVTG
jgi:hypothetical protein